MAVTATELVSCKPPKLNALIEVCTFLAKKQFTELTTPPPAAVPKFSLKSPREFLGGHESTKSLVLVDEFQDPFRLKPRDRPRKMSCCCKACGGCKLSQKFTVVKARGIDSPKAKNEGARMRGLTISSLLPVPTSQFTSPHNSESDRSGGSSPEAEPKTLVIPAPVLTHIEMYLRGLEHKVLPQIKPFEVKADASAELKLPELKVNSRDSYSYRAQVNPSSLITKSKTNQVRSTPTLKPIGQLKLPHRARFGYLQDYALSSKVAKALTAEVKETIRRLPKKALSPYEVRRVVWRKKTRPS